MAKVKGMYSKDDLAGLLLPKLREIAKSLGIRRVEQYKKKELTEKILETEQNKQNGTTGASGDSFRVLTALVQSLKSHFL